MIKISEKTFYLATDSTSYVFRATESGHLEHLHYGCLIPAPNAGGIAALSQKQPFNMGNLISYSEKFPQLGLENIALEMSSYGKGDIREPFICVTNANGSTTSDFLFKSAHVQNKEKLETLPGSYADDYEPEELVVILEDKYASLTLELRYAVYPECDVITRSARLINSGAEMVTVNRLMSLQLDFDDSEMIFTNFSGAWAREMDRHDYPCHQLKLVNSSNTGGSSSRCNPFVMLHDKNATEESGSCYGFNLIYSGNHYEAAQVNGYGMLRFVSGINPDGFSWKLNAGECFEAPEAFMTYSPDGYSKMSLHMHDFIREHIVRGEWKHKERPVLINSWEAAYFKFTQSRLLRMAKKAKEAGVELFVMDDGWFGKRDDDTSSLGDWKVNYKKLPDGLKGLGDKLKAMGLDFGIWVEPEMVNENSNLFRAHSDWVIKIPDREHSVGRNQMILDLTRREVCDYIIKSMSDVFSSADISYVKWDMNRIFSDAYSQALEPERQGEVFHRYICGLYYILDKLTSAFPHILFEACASGGNRFDAGMLCYMPQIWASDDTDAVCRARIQHGYSFGYPQSVIGAHVSNCPNHQTLRTVPIETRFNVAAFGILGYECNLAELPKEDFDAVTEQIKLYKKYRKTLQFGDFYRIRGGEDTDFEHGIYQFMSVSADKTQAVGMLMNGMVRPNYSYEKFKTRGLCDEAEYHFYNRRFTYNIKEFGDLINMIAPVHIKKDSLLHNVIARVKRMEGETEDYVLPGSILNHAGVKLSQGFAGTGYDERVRLFKDFNSRLYLMDKVQQK